jgi:probable HAF family extracellular repeat protein
MRRASMMLLIGLTAMVAGATADTFTFTTIDAPGLSGTVASGINNAGEIVGYGNDNGVYTGFVYSGGAFTYLLFPGSAETEALGVNNNGQIVGAYSEAACTGLYCLSDQGFVDTSGVFTSIDPGGSGTQAIGINDSGEIVGDYNNFNLGFIDNSGVFSTVSVSQSTGLEGINNAGQIVGTAGAERAGASGFLDNGGVLMGINVPNSQFGSNLADGINNAGEIVGSFIPSSQNFGYDGYLDDNGIFTSFSVPGASDTYALGINDSGQIVGYFVDAANQTHGFLATPVATPEPASIALSVLALSAFLFHFARARRAHLR